MLPPPMEAAPSASSSPAPSAPALPAQAVAAPSEGAPAPGARAPRPDPRALRTQAFRAAADLCRARLAATPSGRIARAAAVVVVAGTFAVALAIRVTDGPSAPIEGLLRKAAGAVAWISGGALALAAARDAAIADRRDGVEALVAARGVGASLLGAARTLGATSQIGRSIAVPCALLALATAGLAADVATALRRVAAAFAFLAWGVVAGVTLGALAAACARLFRHRGATALLVLVLGERLVAGSLGFAAWSVPGALRSALALLLGLAGAGGDA